MGVAREIYQDHLDAVSEAIWDRRFDDVAALMAYPHRRRLGTRDIVVDDPDMLRAEARAFRETLDGFGATGYIRVCRHAVSDAPGRIVGWHETFVVRGGTYQVSPYEAEITLLRHGDRWFASDCHAPTFPLSVNNYPLAREADLRRGTTSDRKASQ